MNGKRLALLVVPLLLFLAACQAQTRPQTTDYRTGSQGITMLFAPNLPPSQLYDDQELNAIIEVENKGAHTIGAPGDRIYLTGFDPNIITNIPTQGAQLNRLEGKQPYKPIGDKDFINFKGILRKLAFKNVDKYTPRLQATACYGYTTIAQANLCIDPDPFSPTAKQKVCTPTDASLGTQGAPIAVNTIHIEPAPGTSRFRIDVSNVGGGDVFRYGTGYLTRCSPTSPTGLAYNEINRVFLQDVRIGDISILPSCKPLDQGHLILTNGQGTLYCQLSNVRGSNAYVTTATVELRYGYRTSVTKDLTILQAN